MKGEPVRFYFKARLATKSNMSFHADEGKKNRAERKQGVWLKYADDGWVLTKEEAINLMLEVQNVVSELEEMEQGVSK